MTQNVVYVTVVKFIFKVTQADKGHEKDLPQFLRPVEWRKQVAVLKKSPL